MKSHFPQHFLQMIAAFHLSWNYGKLTDIAIFIIVVSVVNKRSLSVWETKGSGNTWSEQGKTKCHEIVSDQRQI